MLRQVDSLAPQSGIHDICVYCFVSSTYIHKERVEVKCIKFCTT